MGIDDLDLREYSIANKPEYFTDEELELIYENIRLLEQVFPSNSLIELLYALSGQRPAAYIGQKVLTKEASENVSNIDARLGFIQQRYTTTLKEYTIS